MNLHELDWNEVLRELPRWEALSPDARRAFVGITPGQTFTLQSLGGTGKEMREAGLLVAPTGRGTLYGLDPALRPLLAALRAADRLCPLAGVEGRLGPGYVQDQLDLLQAHRIARSGRGYYDAHDRKRAADMASSAAWVRGFLAAETHRKVVKWEEQRLTAKDRPRLVFSAVADALRALVRELAAHPHGVPLSSVAGLVPNAKPEAVASALAAGLRYLLVFVSVGRSADAVVGLLPAVAARLSGTVAPPGPVEARETFAAPFRVGDMTALLVEAATEPIALRAADHSLYVRSQRAIAGRLASVPEWVARFVQTGTAQEDLEDEFADEFADDGEGAEADTDWRVETAANLALLRKLAAIKPSGNRARLEATPTGRAWLAGGEGERLKQVLAALRALPQRNPNAYGGSGELEFFGGPLGFQAAVDSLDTRAALSAAFLSTPSGALVPFAAFARYQAQEHNPFLGPEGPTLRARSFWNNEPSTEAEWEDAWANLLLTFMARRLVPLGCATLGRTAEGAVAFGLTDAGRYLLGERDDFALAPEPGGGEVVVQPDFAIVFLAPAPRAEAELGRLAERTGAGAGVGALFRLTRASVLRAAEQGVSAGQVLETLESVSRSGVPANVARQVRDWMNAIRTIHVAPAVLVRCPDAETAGRVRALGGKHVTEITPTLLRLDADAKTRAALVKRLRDRGIFVATGAGADADAASPPARRGRG